MAKTRRYRSPLRDRQVEQTRELILESLAEIVAVDRVLDFSMSEVAERARVSHATLYRYFPSRQALIDGLTDLAAERMRARGIGSARIRAPEDLPDAVIAGFDAFDELGPLATAGAILSLTSGLRSGAFHERSRRLRAVLDGLLERLPPEERDSVFAFLRHLFSHLTWSALNDDPGMSARRAGAVTAWALRVLLDDLHAGGGPHRDERATR